jgi:hypothetical protein
MDGLRMRRLKAAAEALALVLGMVGQVVLVLEVLALGVALEVRALAQNGTPAWTPKYADFGPTRDGTLPIP